MTKRPDGSLEREIMTVLWDAGTPLLPAEVQARLANELAYTSVATVLCRLTGKGLLNRVPAGRAFRYATVVDESQLAAQRIGEILSAASDRNAALSSLVETLSKRDAKALKQLLERHGR